MPHVPDDLILRAVEDSVKRNRQFNHSEIGREVSAVSGNNGNDIAAELITELQELRLRHIFYILRTVHAV